MKDNLQLAITTLMQSTSIGFLASQGEQSPETSMTPYATFKGDILLHLSTLAKHSQNIAQHPKVSLMVCTPETTATSPLALPRIRFQGQIGCVAKEQQQQAKTTYLQQMPDAEPLFSFADFHLYQLQVTDIFWVGGFAAAQKVTIESWRALSC